MNDEDAIGAKGKEKGKRRKEKGKLITRKSILLFASLFLPS